MFWKSLQIWKPQKSDYADEREMCESPPPLDPELNESRRADGLYGFVDLTKV